MKRGGGAMDDGKILIMGVGGCGSGYIIRTLENCGLDTGGYNSYMQHGPVRAMLRQGVDPKTIKMPRVIKHLGGFMTRLNEHIDRFGWEIEHIFLAVQALDLQLHSYMIRRNIDRDEALRRYKSGLSDGMIQLIERGHRFTVVRCPESILYPEYMYDRLKVVLPDDITIMKFIEAHHKVMIPKCYRHLKARVKRYGYVPTY
jgi:hypothetical protein